MITNRKGLSDVVTTVLIILLVLAAVVIVGNYVLQMVQKGGEKIGGATTCTALQVAPINCSYSGPAGAFVLGLTAKKSGVDANIKELKLVLAKADGTTTTVTATSIPAYLETSTVYSTNVGLFKEFKKVSLVPTITTDSGEVVTCSETAKIDCIG